MVAAEVLSPMLYGRKLYGNRWRASKHIAYLDRAITDAIDGRRPEKLLVVEKPPRHGKSMFCSKIVPSWYLGTHPNRKVMLTSYSADLSRSFGRDARDNLRESADIFGPSIKVRDDVSSASFWQIQGFDGGMLTAGVGGPLTGFGANLAIIDDPIKNPLSLDTPIPTPNGWSTMGDLSVGDRVYDHAGVPCKVVAKSQVWKAKPLRVTFSDGSFVDAHPDHLWTVFERNAHSVYTNSHAAYGENWPEWKNRRTSRTLTLTTKQLQQAGVRNAKGMRRWTIPNALPLICQDQDLPIDPYLLGMWLGDGSKSSPTITCHRDDYSHYESEFRSGGVYSRYRNVSKAAAIGSPNTCVLAFSVNEGRDLPSHTADSAAKRLRAIGVWQNKHIPQEYLRSSYQARLRLLQGLMDSDGTVSNGQVVFTNKNRSLAEGVRELIVSLGACARLVESRGYLFVSSCPNFNPFSIPRKAEKWDAISGKASIRRLNRTIDSIEELPDEASHVCITVDSKHHLFLAGRGMVPTHNSEEALSERIRSKQVDWFLSTLWTRLEPDAVLLIIQTRWHKEDLAGWVLTHAAEELGVPVRRVSFPAIAIEDDDELGRKIGEALWPSQWPLIELEKKKRVIQGYWWDALFQQDPGVYGNAEWPREYFDDAKIWADAAEWPDAFEAQAIAVDPSKGKDAKKGDYSAIVSTGFARNTVWVDVSIERRPVEAIAVDAVRMSYRTGCGKIGLEANAFQDLIGPEITRAAQTLGVIAPEVLLFYNSVEKTLRISRLGPPLEVGQIKIRRNAGGELLVKQLKDFPYGDHDDGPDALEMSLRLLRQELAGEPSAEEERWQI